MPIFHNFLVGLSGTDVDGDLIRYASEVARILKPAKIDFVHVRPGDGPTRETSLHGLNEHLGELPPEIQKSTSTRRGRPLDELIKFAVAQKSELILVGRRKGRDGRRSLARRLAMNAPCSVWVVAHGTPPSFDRILAPVDFSARTADSLSVAAEFAASADAGYLHPLHVYFNDTIVTYEERDELTRKERREAFNKFIAPINLHHFPVQLIFEEGPNIARAITRVADRLKADLIVMETRGRNRAASLILGSETENTIIESRIPVLAVKRFGAGITLFQAVLDKKFWRKPTPRFG
jgi:nucleotide-binding universal stress UspA family protein